MYWVQAVGAKGTRYEDTPSLTCHPPNHAPEYYTVRGQWLCPPPPLLPQDLQYLGRPEQRIIVLDIKPNDEEKYVRLVGTSTGACGVASGCTRARQGVGFCLGAVGSTG